MSHSVHPGVRCLDETRYSLVELSSLTLKQYAANRYTKTSVRYQIQTDSLLRQIGLRMFEKLSGCCPS